MTGIVIAGREPVLSVIVIGTNGNQQQVEAVMDTGFTGFLTLPPETIAFLALPWIGIAEGTLANGSIEQFDVHRAVAIWNDQPRMIEVEAAATKPMLGMEILFGHAVRMEVVPGGSLVGRLPETRSSCYDSPAGLVQGGTLWESDGPLIKSCACCATPTAIWPRA